MSEEGDTFFVNLAEKLIGIFLIIIGAVMIYFAATTSGSSGLGAFTVFFGILSFILLIIGVFLLLVRPSE
jgi:uncharacterized membrane protein